MKHIQGLRSQCRPVYYGLEQVSSVVTSMSSSCCVHAYQILKYKEQLIILSDHLLQLDHTRVVQLAEGFHFPQRHAFLPAEELALHFLDGHLHS